MTDETCTAADGGAERMVYADYLAEMKETTQRNAIEHEQEVRERLMTMRSHRGDGIPTQFVNPDGPGALALLDHHKARADRAEAALRDLTGAIIRDFETNFMLDGQIVDAPDEMLVYNYRLAIAFRDGIPAATPGDAS